MQMENFHSSYADKDYAQKKTLVNTILKTILPTNFIVTSLK